MRDLSLPFNAWALHLLTVIQMFKGCMYGNIMVTNTHQRLYMMFDQSRSCLILRENLIVL